MKKRLFAAIVSLCMIVSMLPTMAFAEAGVQDSGIVTSASGLCEHHTQHDESCSYTEGTAEIPCSHEHDESCGGLTDPEACNHSHDEACGYVPATEGTPCTFVCEVCNAQDSGKPATPSDAQPEECTCETLCTEEEINEDCPVCSAEGADLDKVCVGAALLLTAPTLRTGEIKLFIGGQQITESGCYENKNGTWTKVDGTEPANGQFSYDAATFTLTLNEAEITNNQTVNVAEGYTYDGSVIAFSQTADVSLKIALQGDSTITGTGGIRVDSKTGNASLSIKGPGSLNVEPKGSNSGITLCSSKNTNLDIVGADVTASSPAQYGVYLISSTDASSTSTITVNNGSLTTGGNGNVGIYYYWSGTSNAGTSSLTVSGNAVVDTRNSQIMAQNKETVVQVGAGSDGNGGIVFNGKSGTVYGNVTLQGNLEISEGESLNIPEGASLTVPEDVTLTNKGDVTTTGRGTLTNNGKIENSGTLPSNIKGIAPPRITTTSPLASGTVGTAYSSVTLEASCNPTSWEITEGFLPADLTLDKSTGVISGTPTANGTFNFTVKATNDGGSDSKSLSITISQAANVSVESVSLDKTILTLTEGGTAQLTATVEPSNATNKNVTWSSNNESVATVDASGVVTAVAPGTAAITATADGKSATCTVTVTAKPSPDRPVITKPSSSRISGADRFETAMETADQLKKELGVTEFSAIVVACSDDFADALSASAFAHENEAPVLIVNENNEERVKTYIEQNLTKDGTVYIMGGSAAVTGGFEDSLSDFDTVRFAGDDRYETNLNTLKELDLTGKQDIIIASGMDFADALSASSTGCPIMIVGERLTEPQIAFLKTLGGDDTYYIAGGTAAVSVEVEEQLRALNAGSVKRLAGEDRYETGVLIAETFYGRTGSVYIASGEDFPDGLTGGVLAGLTGDGKGAPLILVNRNNTERAAEYIDDVNQTR